MATCIGILSARAARLPIQWRAARALRAFELAGQGVLAVHTCETPVFSLEYSVVLLQIACSGIHTIGAIAKMPDAGIAAATQ
jgi:hypothetical protein